MTLEDERLLANLLQGGQPFREKGRDMFPPIFSKRNPNEEKAIKSYLYLPSLEWQTCNKSKTHSTIIMAGHRVLLGFLGLCELLVIKLSYNLSQWA